MRKFVLPRAVESAQTFLKAAVPRQTDVTVVRTRSVPRTSQSVLVSAQVEKCRAYPKDATHHVVTAQMSLNVPQMMRFVTVSV